MSRQEIYAWCSTGFVLSVLILYTIFSFGFPSILENHYESVIKGLVFIILVAVATEFTIDYLGSVKYGVHKDERDMQIEATAFKVGYYSVMVFLNILIGHLIINAFFGTHAGEAAFLTSRETLLHVVIYMLFLGGLMKSGTQVFLYRRGG